MNEIECPRWYSCLSTEHKELLQKLIETSDPENKTELVNNIMKESGVEEDECENLIEWWFVTRVYIIFFDFANFPFPLSQNFQFFQRHLESNYWQ